MNNASLLVAGGLEVIPSLEVAFGWSGRTAMPVSSPVTTAAGVGLAMSCGRPEKQIHGRRIFTQLAG
jgi:hypothetical protein